MDFKKIGEKVLFGLKWFFHSYIWLFVLGFVTDLVTKLVMVNYFKTHTDPIIIIGTKSNPFLQIDYVINNGIAFGFQTGNELANKIIFSIVSIVGAAAIIGLYVYNFKKFNAFLKACLMLMLVGALGNLIDRLFYTTSFLHNPWAGVVDWIDFIGIKFAVFNIADSCVVIGVFMLIVWLIVDEVKAVRAKRAEEVKETGGKVLSKEEQKRLEEQQPEEHVEEKVEEPEPAEESEKE